MTAIDDRKSVAHACAAHIGFAGARDLFPGIGDPQRRAKFGEELTRQVTDKLKQLHAHPRLSLHEGHFFVGVMQIGSGGEGILADACDSSGIALRVLLPQARDEFLAARSPRAPFDEDFSPAQREKTLQRLQRASVLQERVASVASERSTRFAETAAEVLRLADIALILQPKHRDGLGKPGRTNEFAEHALRSGKPLYALTFWIDETQKLHVYDELRYPRDLTWQPPRLPAVLPAPALTLDDMAQRIATECSALAHACSRQCTRASEAVVRRLIALIAIGTVSLALVSVFRNTVTGSAALLLPLAAALLLVPGVIALRRMFSASASATAAVRQRWTALHLAAEIARSTLAFAPQTVNGDAAHPATAPQPHDFGFLFAAPLPDDARVLAQTLAVAHLRRSRGARRLPWQEFRDRYLRERLGQDATGELGAYRDKLARVRQHVGVVGWQLAALGLFAASAVAAVLIVPVPAIHGAGRIATAVAALAMLLPVSALAFHAQRCLFKHRLRELACADLLGRLQQLSQRLQRATGEADFVAAQAETETRLLAATLDWYRWRRFDS
ncbi:MAG: hypothetical protein JNN30_07885 [Rhodanobacteraceae bacterium]|nr:hypothetical protein [Rhodanobacteraceae bacterium]